MLGGRRGRRRLLQRVVLTHERRDVPLLRLPVLLKLLHPPVVGLDLLPEYHILYLGGLLVKLEAAGAVEALEVEVPLPPDADAVEDDGGVEVHLLGGRESCSYYSGKATQEGGAGGGICMRGARANDSAKKCFRWPFPLLLPSAAQRIGCIYTTNSRSVHVSPMMRREAEGGTTYSSRPSALLCHLCCTQWVWGL